MSTAERSLRQLIQEMLILEAPAPEEDIFKGSGFTGLLQGKRIVILGDSQVAGNTDPKAPDYTFGDKLETRFQEQGAVVKRFGWGGSAAKTWIAGLPKFGKQFTLKQVNDSGPYDIAVISLGTNDSGNAEANRTPEEKAAGIFRPESEVSKNCETAAKKIAEVVDGVKASKVYWVGPPATTGKRDSSYSPRARDFIYQHTTPLVPNTIDSRGIPVGSDGIHVIGAADQWVDLVFNRIAGEATQ